MKRVLVIDDEPRIKDLFATTLERERYDVLMAESGRKGLDMFRWKRPDLVVLELRLPEMGGITVLQDIRGIDVGTPVVILTEAGTEKTRKQAKELGAATFIEKRYLFHRLEETLLGLLLARDHLSSQGPVEAKREFILG